jgi:hypothetical protein
LATRRPEAIEAIVVQNGNAYDEGFSAADAGRVSPLAAMSQMT